MIANEIRGETAISLEGADYPLRPSYEAQVAVERATGRSLRQLAEAAHAGSLTIEQAATIVAEFVKAEGRALLAAGDQSGRALAGFNAARVGELLVEEGMVRTTARLELALYLAITGGYTAAGEPKAQAETTATPAAD